MLGREPVVRIGHDAPQLFGELRPSQLLVLQVPEAGFPAVA